MAIAGMAVIVIDKTTKRLEGYPYLSNQQPVKTRMQNGVRVLEINGRLLEKITIDQALDLLDKKERDAIYMVYLLGVDPDEASGFFKMSRWGIYKRLKRGIKKLEKILHLVENANSHANC